MKLFAKQPEIPDSFPQTIYAKVKEPFNRSHENFPLEVSKEDFSNQPEMFVEVPYTTAWVREATYPQGVLRLLTAQELKSLKLETEDLMVNEDHSLPVKKKPGPKPKSSDYENKKSSSGGTGHDDKK